MPSRLDPIIYCLVINKLATYVELKTLLDVDDMLDLYEACLVESENRRMLNDEIHKGHRT